MYAFAFLSRYAKHTDVSARTAHTDGPAHGPTKEQAPGRHLGMATYGERNGQPAIQSMFMLLQALTRLAHCQRSTGRQEQAIRPVSAFRC